MASTYLQPLETPVRTIILCFTLWKVLLLLIAACSPGPGYDTSTSLLLSTLHSVGQKKLPLVVQYLIGKLVRWDAIYFVRVSNRGYLYEQEWAFGWGFTRMIKFSTMGLGYLGIPHYDGMEGLVGILLAHSSHLLSILVLHSLTLTLFPSKRFALVTALLHVISPAGIFMSAPYAESSCALLTFLGVFLFTKSFGSGANNATLGHDLLVLLSGIVFGVATTFRSNALLNGLLLLEEAFRTFISLGNGFKITTIRRLIITGLGGICVGTSFLLPQYLAYQEYCGETALESSRLWCTDAIPSIYTFVQGYYWNGGLFNYWTLPNIPLFLLAMPMIIILGVSSNWGIRDPQLQQISATPKKESITTVDKIQYAHKVQIIRNLALSQLILTAITFTSGHVQIITRISSICPVYLWYMAASVGKEKDSTITSVGRFMIIYAGIQGGLFSSFLPPA
ncbi:GPI mannosyltransferase 2 [Sclerotinia borealis F-4128]|uniref:GPI mannosyltransferase 2 n=1 Tax=Sclerotinia borealis (strain F-4128) TaxID=1432307 RepID=W9CXI1_SCLBF|nr:GPI mannosyltransferase 2 [Sclerotinia borealis F-4128]